MTFTFTLFKNTIFSNGRGPALLTSDACLGPYAGDDVLPGCSSNARDIILREAAGLKRPDDPEILIEPGGDRRTYMLEWLQIRQEEIERAELIVKIVQGMKKNEDSR